MTRKPSDIVQPNLRIREDLRRRLEVAAKERGVSLNAEMTYRLERSFEQDAKRIFGEVAMSMSLDCSRLISIIEQLRKASGADQSEVA